MAQPFFPRIIRNLIRALVVVSALSVSACGSTATQSVTAPVGDKCAVSLTSSPASFAADGGAGTVSVETQPECAWTASVGAVWLTDVSPTQGQGAGQLQFRVAANGSASARDGTITVNAQRAQIHQDGAACQFSVTPGAARVAATGGSGSFALSAAAGCPWSAASTVNWVTVSPRSGSGPVTLAYTVASNAGPERSGSITVGGATFAITQDAAGTAPPPGSCAASINPTSQSISAAAATGIAVAVTAASGCAWTASSNATWLTIASGASGSSNGTVVLNASANSGAARSGTVTIAGLTFTVNQAGTGTGTCTYTLNPTSRSATASSSTGNQVAVSTTSGCTWTASSNASWLTVTAGASGSGNGNVTYSVASNTGPARTGTLTIAGLTFTVDQAGNCSYSLNPTSRSANASASTGNQVAVSANTGCTWTATSNASWLTVTAGASGSGNGTVVYSVAANTGPARTGTLTIAGLTFTVNQASGCLFVVLPTTQTISGAGGAGLPITVTTELGCTWTATANQNWLHITAGASGTGPGIVTFTADAYTGGGNSRSGTLTVASQTVTVTQNK